MEPKEISPKNLQKVWEDLKKGSDEARGNYLFKDFRIQVSKYKASGAERTSRLYHKRREDGLCIRCGAQVETKNPRTGKLYRLCDLHRTMIDKRTAEENEAAKKREAKKAATKTRTRKAKATAADQPKKRGRKPKKVE